MSRSLFISLLLISLSLEITAQNSKKEFQIALPETKISNSQYNSISYLDCRFDTTGFGTIQIGQFNKKTKVVAKIPMAAQLENVFNALVDSTAKNGELLFQLRRFSFAEFTGLTKEKGYCYIRASLYSKKVQLFQKIALLDTVILVKSSDVTRSLKKNASPVLTDFLATIITKPNTNSAFLSLNDILKIDSIEKQALPLYATTVYPDGIYYSYSAFKNLLPDTKAIIDTNTNGTIMSVAIRNEKGRKKKLKSESFYSVVYKGQPYISTDYAYYPLKKIGSDFYFKGKTKLSVDFGEVAAAGFFLGIGGSIAASHAVAIFDMKIDHINGDIIIVGKGKRIFEWPSSTL